MVVVVRIQAFRAPGSILRLVLKYVLEFNASLNLDPNSLHIVVVQSGQIFVNRTQQGGALRWCG